MKTLALCSFLALTLGFANTAHSAVITCLADPRASDNDTINQTGIIETITGNCQVHGFDFGEDSGWKSKSLRMKLKGVGAGAYFAWTAPYVFVCPNVLYQNFLKSPFYGMKANAGLLVGVDGVLYANKRGGVCVLTGAHALTVGAGISGSKVEFEEMN